MPGKLVKSAALRMPPPRFTDLVHAKHDKRSELTTEINEMWATGRQASP
jgi:hypothetical protein